MDWNSSPARCIGIVCMPLVACGLAAGLVGCGTVVHGTYQSVTVDTTPSGATVAVQNAYGESALGGYGASSAAETYVTPASIQLSRRRDTVLTISKPGYQTQTVTVLAMMDGSVAENLLKGGFIGGVVDMGTGAAFRLVPDKVSLSLVPTTGGNSLASADSLAQMRLNGADRAVVAAPYGDPGVTPRSTAGGSGVPTAMRTDWGTAGSGAQVASSTNREQLPAAQRLRALDQLHTDGLITEAEYQKYRAMILSRVSGESEHANTLLATEPKVAAADAGSDDGSETVEEDTSEEK